MKIKRKLYPNSNDKEFILMSVNDLIKFSLDSYERMSSDTKNDDVVVAKKLVDDTLFSFGIKTPASHLKKTKKGKVVKSNHNPHSETDKEILKLYAETALPKVNDPK